MLGLSQTCLLRRYMTEYKLEGDVLNPMDILMQDQFGSWHGKGIFQCADTQSCFHVCIHCPAENAQVKTIKAADSSIPYPPPSPLICAAYLIMIFSTAEPQL